MEKYLQLSQDLSISESKRYEYLAAYKLGMLMWEDIKYELCKKFDIPETRDFGIDLVSPDFSKIGQVKCFSSGTSISWSTMSTFLSYSFLLKAEPVLVTDPNVNISKMVLRAIPNIVFVDKSGVVKYKEHYIEEGIRIINETDIKKLPALIKTMQHWQNNICANIKKEQINVDYTNWIQNNSPGDMSKEDYYELFKTSCGEKFIPSKNKFSTIMMKSGYTTNDSHRPRRWRLN